MPRLRNAGPELGFRRIASLIVGDGARISALVEQHVTTEAVKVLVSCIEADGFGQVRHGFVEVAEPLQCSTQVGLRLCVSGI